MAFHLPALSYPIAQLDSSASPINGLAHVLTKGMLVVLSAISQLCPTSFPTSVAMHIGLHACAITIVVNSSGLAVVVIVKPTYSVTVVCLDTYS